MNYQENVLLSKEDLIKIRKILKNKEFEDFKIHKHYWLNGIELEEASKNLGLSPKILSAPDKINLIIRKIDIKMLGLVIII
ncbi:unnamed protein product [marine sediment metagenome]|uniref:Uncharacterized protein n=1 Tax=marine sediment metagenome TaxID=412755 RepID=X1P0W2_9ZZZZ